MIKLASANGTPESVVRRSYLDRKYPWKERYTPLFNDVVYEHYQNLVDFAYDQKMIRRKIELDTWFDKRFVPVALHELDIENHWKPVVTKVQRAKPVRQDRRTGVPAKA